MFFVAKYAFFMLKDYYCYSFMLKDYYCYFLIFVSMSSIVFLLLSRFMQNKLLHIINKRTVNGNI